MGQCTSSERICNFRQKDKVRCSEEVSMDLIFSPNELPRKSISSSTNKMKTTREGDSSPRSSIYILRTNAMRTLTSEDHSELIEDDESTVVPKHVFIDEHFFDNSWLFATDRTWSKGTTEISCLQEEDSTMDEVRGDFEEKVDDVEGERNRQNIGETSHGISHCNRKDYYDTSLNDRLAEDGPQSF